MEKIKKVLKNNILFLKFHDAMWKVLIDGFHLNRYLIKRGFKRHVGYDFEIDNPKTLNEKIQWLKLYKRDPLATICADKYGARKYLSDNFGKDKLIPLEFQTCDWRDIKPENIPDYPVAIKANHGSGMNMIIRDKGEVNWEDLRKKCRVWLNKNYYYRGLEWQYKNIKPRIIVEKLLLDKEGKLPNDYKLNFFNGELEFVYCSVDREGGNHRNIYTPDWKPLEFSWVNEEDHRESLIGPDIKKPKSFDEMVRIGSEIAKNFDFVRVDFYDVDGKLYYGEVTLHHGGGFDTFKPKEYDLIYGKKLKLTKKHTRL